MVCKVVECQSLTATHLKYLCFLVFGLPHVGRVPPPADGQKSVALGRFCVRAFQDSGGGFVVFVEALDDVLTELFDLLHVVLEAESPALEPGSCKELHLVSTDFAFHLGHPVNEADPSYPNDQGEGAWLFLDFPADGTLRQSLR